MYIFAKYVNFLTMDNEQFLSFSASGFSLLKVVELKKSLLFFQDDYRLIKNILIFSLL